MKTKREVLEEYAKNASCGEIQCKECPYRRECLSGEGIHNTLTKIGAMLVLVLIQNSKKKRKFDPNKALTSITADKAKVGMKGYFADNLADLKKQFVRNEVQTLTRRFSEEHYARFEADDSVVWVLFYPINEFEVE